MSLTTSVEALITTLGDLDPHALVLADAARVLALEAVAGETADGKPKSAASAVRELRSTLSELVERGRSSADDDAEWPGIAEIRNVSELRPADVRPRGRGGGAAAG